MKTVKYILVNDCVSRNVGFHSTCSRIVRDSFVSDLRYCHVVEFKRLDDVGFKFFASKAPLRVERQDSGFRFFQPLGLSRKALLAELVRLRLRYPTAKILGLSELGRHRVHPSDEMNGVRREMSGELGVLCKQSAPTGRARN